MRYSRPVVATSLLAILAACGGPKIARKDAAAVIQGDKQFKSSKYVYVPRTIAIPAEGLGMSAAAREGEALSVVQIASVDPVVAILRARGEVTIEDFVSPVPGSAAPPPVAPAPDTTTHKDSVKFVRDSAAAAAAKADTTKKDTATVEPKKDFYTSPPPVPPLAQAWVHTLRVTPHPQIRTADLNPDDGEAEDAPRSFGAVDAARTPGWVLTIGGRDFVRVLAVSDYVRAPGQPDADATVDFLWRWKASGVGTPFDVESAEFESLPREVQQAAIAGGVTIDTSNPHWSRATLLRDPAGWRVVSVDWTYGDGKPHDRW